MLTRPDLPDFRYAYIAWDDPHGRQEQEHIVIFVGEGVVHTTLCGYELQIDDGISVDQTLIERGVCRTCRYKRQSIIRDTKQAELAALHLWNEMSASNTVSSRQ